MKSALTLDKIIGEASRLGIEVTLNSDSPGFFIIDEQGGFPDWFEFAGTDNDAYRQIGNAVAVPMGRWVGRVIKQYFE